MFLCWMCQCLWCICKIFWNFEELASQRHCDQIIFRYLWNFIKTNNVHVWKLLWKMSELNRLVVKYPVGELSEWPRTRVANSFNKNNISSPDVGGWCQASVLMILCCRVSDCVNTKIYRLVSRAGHLVHNREIFLYCLRQTSSGWRKSFLFISSWPLKENKKVEKDEILINIFTIHF